MNIAMKAVLLVLVVASVAIDAYPADLEDFEEANEVLDDGMYLIYTYVDTTSC